MLTSLLASTASASSVSTSVAAQSTSLTSAEPSLTQEQKKSLAITTRYQHDVERALRLSASRRDQALSTQLMHFDEPYGPGKADAARGALLRKAAEGAPKDRVVQWIWSNAAPGASGCETRHPCPDRAGALARLEPDNAAAWVPVLAEAARSNGVAGIDGALSHMAVATRYDEVFHETMGAWFEVFRRFPPPLELLRMPDGRTGDATLLAEVSALAQVAAAFAPYQGLVQSCQRDKHPEAAASRFEKCAKAGRLMLDESTMFLPRFIGRTMLRVSGLANDEDRKLALTTEWQYEQHKRLTPTDESNLTPLRQQMDLLVASDSEVEAAQQDLRRASVPLSPPPGWWPTRDGKPLGPLGEDAAPAKQP